MQGTTTLSFLIRISKFGGGGIYGIKIRSTITVKNVNRKGHTDPDNQRPGKWSSGVCSYIEIS